MKISEFVEKLDDLDKRLQSVAQKHPDTTKLHGVKTHQPGSAPDRCPHCKKMNMLMDQTIKFEQEHLGTSRLAANTFQKNVQLVRTIIKMMKEEGEL